ncbi:MAG: hypothetical protein IJJ33_17230 [Victivallales bacterium]|nr:hypothetical protein [Victivallales bacterium]MBQ6473732.1 hypothetical protein [Victivallales bacterium]
MAKNMLLVLTVVLAGLVSCVSGAGSRQQTKKTQYVNPDEIIAGSAETMTMYDLESSTRQLMERMLAHPQFIANYNAVKDARGQLPIVVIGNIENKTTERIQSRLVAVGDTVRVALFDSELFEVRDDQAASAIKSRIVDGVDGGLENDALVQTMGMSEPPDFIILGDLRHFSDVGGYHTYRLRLSIQDFRSNTVVWEGIQTKVKL